MDVLTPIRSKIVPVHCRSGAPASVVTAGHPPSLGADDGTTYIFKVTRNCNSGFADSHERVMGCEIRS